MINAIKIDVSDSVKHVEMEVELPEPVSRAIITGRPVTIGLNGPDNSVSFTIKERG